MYYLYAAVAFAKTNWLAIAGLLSGVLIYFLQKRTKRPWYSTKSSVIAADERSATRGLQVSFRGTQMARVCITKIVFWNSGNVAIRRDDIPTNNPLRLVAKKDITILDGEVLAANNQNSGVKSDFIDGALTISFDYLAPQNGFVLNIVHTGKNGTSLEMVGEFIDFRPLRRVPVMEAAFFKRFLNKPHAGRIKFFRFVSLSSWIVIGAAPAIGVYFQRNTPFSYTAWLPAALIALLYWGTALSMYYFRVPSGLEVYLE